MDLFNEIDDLNDLFLLEKNPKLDSAAEGYEDLQSKYSSLHENYTKEMENSKKVEKCLVKCLKFYSKLSKKYEIQQKVISNLEETVKEKVISLEEAQRNEERMKGLIQVYRTERTLFAGQTNTQLRKDKEILLDICCKLISESVRNNTIRSLTTLLLRKFRKDLDDEKVNLLKGKNVKLKDELEFGTSGDLKSEFVNLKSEEEFKSENKYSNEITKVEVEEDTKNNLLDLSVNKTMVEENSCLDNKDLNSGSDEMPFAETKEVEPRVISSLPSLEELPLSHEPQCSNSDSSDSDKQCQIEKEYNLSQSSNATLEISNSNPTVAPSDKATEFPSSSDKPADSGLTLKNYSVSSGQNEPLIRSSKNSIFDISDECLNMSNSKAETKAQDSTEVDLEFFADRDLENRGKSEDFNCAHNANEDNLNLPNSEEESTFPYEKELFKIFREMSSIRLLSPIRESTNSLSISRTCSVVPDINKSDGYEKSVSKTILKRDLSVEKNSCKNKKFKSEEEKTNCSLLDSIMSAMSVQNEKFKAKGVATNEVETGAEISVKSPCNPTEGTSPSEDASTRACLKKKKLENGGSKENYKSPRNIQYKQQAIEKLVTDEIKNFVASPISSNEDADRNVRHCLSVLSNKSEDVIAKCIVAIVLENVDEAVEIFERPSPPLTKTQHRLIVLLSVFRKLDSNSEKILSKILLIISEKLLPDNFFWPDDSVEAATRFYAALCRARNDPKTLWKFCLNAITDMKQRCPLLMFTVLKTWPDVLYDASTLKNNILAVTTVNIFLHMPKKEGLRNFNQGQKLVALKHLLMKFYQFKVEDSIEGWAKKVLEAVCREEPGSEKSIVLLSKYKDQSWTAKNVVPTLRSMLVKWSEEKVEDSAANRILSVIKQICPILQEDSHRAKIKDLVLCLSEILATAKKNHESEVNIVEVLLQFKQYPEARNGIREWIPKNPISDSLRNEVINASAENILRELKLNRKKEPKHISIKKKLKKQSKKSKGKKKKGKKSKKIK